MRETIEKLSRGATLPEIPLIRLTPERLYFTVGAGMRLPLPVGVWSLNGQIVKGLCISDDPRMKPESMSFAGRRAQFSVTADAAGLEEGDVRTGSLTLVTNGGEFPLPWRMEVSEAPAYPDAGDFDPAGSALLYGAKLVFPEDESEAEALRAEEKESTGEYIFPEDEEDLTEIVSSLIREHAASDYAFHAYREAIARGISLNRLYESYLAARPVNSGDPLPRELIIYFSYESELPQDLASRLYAAILRQEDPSSELMSAYLPRMSAFAMSQAIEGRIDEDLALIYDSMIYSDMIDERAALALPDILKAHEISVTGGEADCVLVSYPDLRQAVRARVVSGLAYVPVWFEDASISFYREKSDPGPGGEELYEDVSEKTACKERALFDRPDLLKRCFTLRPDHRMLLLAAIRSICRDGVSSESDIDILKKGLSGREFSPSLRASIIRTLAQSDTGLEWLGLVREEDFHRETLGYLFGAFMDSGDFERAWALTKKYGPEAAGDHLRELLEALTADPETASREDEELLRFSIYLFDRGGAGAPVIHYLASHYTGGAEHMLSVMREAMREGERDYCMSGRLLTIMLFSGVHTDIDQVFRYYIEGGEYEEDLVRAYFRVRTRERFLYEEEVDEEVLFSALSSYMKAVRDPLAQPVIFILALTEYYSRQESLKEDDAALCRLLTERLIGAGLIFRYTKKLRKLIYIPEEICWKYYIEYRAPRGSSSRPKLLMRIRPDEHDYSVREMDRVYENVYVFSAVLFTGDSLHYLIYPEQGASEIAEEGTINVVKLHRQSNERMECLSRITGAIERRDREVLREDMLGYAENDAMLKLLFDLE